MPQGSAYEARTTIRVHYAPKITVGPHNPLNVMVGTDATLTCSVLANPPVRSVRWMKRGQLLSNTYNHTIPSVTPEDSGNYACVADNGILQPSQVELHLSVLYGPRVNVLPEQEAAQGENVAIKCNVASNPEPQSILWTKQGDGQFALQGATHYVWTVSRLRMLELTYARPQSSCDLLLLPSIQKWSATTLLCCTQTWGEAEITPQGPTAVAGRPFVLTCGARPPGWPRPEYRWWREGQEHIDLGHRSNHSFLSVHSSHEGRYYCQPHNALGKGSIASVYLAVNEAATIIVPLRPQIIRKAGDQSQSVTCRARGKPKPQVHWTHRDKELQMSPESGFEIKTIENIEDNEVFSVQSTLTFQRALTPEDRGKYACLFDNGFGGAAKSEMMLRIEHPPQVRHTYNRVAFDPGDMAVLRCQMQAYP
ncbi:hypothetical protein MRX96_012249 [Rhipicephalus microplus]